METEPTTLVSEGMFLGNGVFQITNGMLKLRRDENGQINIIIGLLLLICFGLVAYYDYTKYKRGNPFW